jgi:beta-galactosidase
VSTRLTGPALRAVLARAYLDAGVAPPSGVPEGVELVRRGPYTFVINHLDTDVDVDGTVPAGSVRVDRT